jgi:hypothetical protein
LLIASLAALLVFLSPGKPDGAASPVSVGRFDSIPIREPIYYRAGNFWLVRLSEKEVVAFVAVDPGSVGCTSDERLRIGPGQTAKSIIWDTKQFGYGQQGVFRAICYHTFYSINGDRVFGPGLRSLSRYPVTVDKSGFVSVLPGKDKIIRGKIAQPAHSLGRHTWLA